MTVSIKRRNRKMCIYLLSLMLLSFVAKCYFNHSFNIEVDKVATGVVEIQSGEDYAVYSQRVQSHYTNSFISKILADLTFHLVVFTSFVYLFIDIKGKGKNVE